MMNYTTLIPATETLSQSELFQRFLEAPIRLGTMSTLAQPSVSPLFASMEEFFLAHHGGASESVGEVLAEEILAGLRKSESPSTELQVAIGVVADLLADMKTLAYEFGLLCHQASVEEFDEGASEPRYALPVLCLGEAIMNTAKSVVDEARAAA